MWRTGIGEKVQRDATVLIIVGHTIHQQTRGDSVEITADLNIKSSLKHITELY